MTRRYFLYAYFYLQIAFKIILLIIKTNFFMFKQLYKNRKKFTLNTKSSGLSTNPTVEKYSIETLEEMK